MQDSGGGAGLHARVESKYGPVDLVRITVQDSTVNNNTMGVSRCMHGMLSSIWCKLCVPTDLLLKIITHPSSRVIFTDNTGHGRAWMWRRAVCKFVRIRGVE